MIAGSSTAEAVRTVAGHDGPWAALGNRTAAEHYGCVVLAAGVEDVPGNETRFVWLARADVPASVGVADEPAIATALRSRPRSCSGARAPNGRGGWSHACRRSRERGVNLTRIESRPRRQGLGSYMFFVDMEGRVDDPHVQAGAGGGPPARRGRARDRLVSGRSRLTSATVSARRSLTITAGSWAGRAVTLPWQIRDGNLCITRANPVRAVF